jgi:hypothetical protein
MLPGVQVPHNIRRDTLCTAGRTLSQFNVTRWHITAPVFGWPHDSTGSLGVN